MQYLKKCYFIYACLSTKRNNFILYFFQGLQKAVSNYLFQVRLINLSSLSFWFRICTRSQLLLKHRFSQYLSVHTFKLSTMKLSEFILLDEEMKKETVLHQGVLIGKRQVQSSMIFLFQLQNYYVETWCNFKNRSVQEYRIFDNTKSLAPYLAAISIDDLLN